MRSSPTDVAETLHDVLAGRHSLDDDDDDDGTSNLLSPSGADSQPFVSIGRGSFGIIFALPADIILWVGRDGYQGESQDWGGDRHMSEVEMGVIVKRTISLRQGENKDLENDAVWHERIESTFNNLRRNVHLPLVPRLLGYLPNSDASQDTAEGTDAEDTIISPSKLKIAATSRTASLNDWWTTNHASTRLWTDIRNEGHAEYQIPDQVLLVDRIPPSRRE